jgi:hypothetical protein
MAIKKNRSNAQNDLYWGYCVEPFAKYLEKDGYTKDDVHELLKSECNYSIKISRDKNGLTVEKKVARSTTGLTTKEFGEFLDRIVQYAAEQGCKSLFELRSRLIYIPQRVPRWYGSLMDNLHFTLSS